MNALTSAECWSDQGGRCGSEINQAKDLLDTSHANRHQWTGSLRPGVCVDLGVAALALLKVVVNKVLADQDQDIAAKAFMSFDRAVKLVKSDDGRVVHKAVLEKLEMFQGATLHKSLFAVVERIEKDELIVTEDIKVLVEKLAKVVKVVRKTWN